MNWTWDQAKNERTATDRGFDFTYASRIFDGLIFLRPADRHGERRWQAIGVIEGRYYSVIYTKRWSDGTRIRRIISARRARDYEIQAHQDHYAR